MFKNFNSLIISKLLNINEDGQAVYDKKKTLKMHVTANMQK